MTFNAGNFYQLKLSYQNGEIRQEDLRNDINILKLISIIDMNIHDTLVLPEPTLHIH